MEMRLSRCQAKLSKEKDIDRKSLHHQLEKKEKEFVAVSNEYAKLSTINASITLLKVVILINELVLSCQVLMLVSDFLCKCNLKDLFF